MFSVFFFGSAEGPDQLAPLASRCGRDNQTQEHAAETLSPKNLPGDASAPHIDADKTLFTAFKLFQDFPFNWNPAEHPPKKDPTCDEQVCQGVFSPNRCLRLTSSGQNRPAGHTAVQQTPLAVARPIAPSYLTMLPFYSHPCVCKPFCLMLVQQICACVNSPH
ncbi:hypothetical protein BaRGS_00004008 [Batillaria attramentaria]|uniref:Uncharacterized protein n=1 Tax=Batillaria attramentaria TaxID=370345 RepID=A0ABD0LZE9_9CAEN